MDASSENGQAQAWRRSFKGIHSLLKGEPMKKETKKALLIYFCIIASGLFWGYLMRNDPVPPDCIREPENAACLLK